MTSIYFVRHAQPDYKFKNTSDRPLTNEGLQDRLKAADVLEKIDISAIYSSPYKRAYDTVLPLAERLGLEIVVDSRLRERLSGDVVGDFLDFTRRQWRNFTFKTKVGECLQEVQERNIEAVKAILAAHPNQNVVVGTHGTSLSTIINYYISTSGFDDFLRIIDYMPYILKMNFDGERFISSEEIFHIEKTYVKPSSQKQEG